MYLLIEIAWTHVTTRIRQTVVAILGVASGVGFTILAGAYRRKRSSDNG